MFHISASVLKGGVRTPQGCFAQGYFLFLKVLVDLFHISAGVLKENPTLLRGPLSIVVASKRWISTCTSTGVTTPSAGDRRSRKRCATSRSSRCSRRIAAAASRRRKPTVRCVGILQKFVISFYLKEPIDLYTMMLGCILHDEIDSQAPKKIFRLRIVTSLSPGYVGVRAKDPQHREATDAVAAAASRRRKPTVRCVGNLQIFVI